MKKINYIGVIAALTSFLCCSCARPSYDNFISPTQGESELVPVASLNISNSYENVPPTQEETLAVFTSDDGLCTIEKKKSYYDVTLRYDLGDSREVGAAYAETILEAVPDYAERLEPYLHENISSAFSGLNGDYSAVSERVNTLYSALPEEYRNEIDGFADAVCGGITGYNKDGVLSRDEARLAQMVPDVLRGTACSSISVGGEKTESGERITSRTLEWQLGSENQLCSIHCVVHMINGEKSLTSVSFLGLLDVLTAVNDDGVMLGVHDVGSTYGEEYTCDGKSAYSFATRYALENFKSAHEAGDYLVKNAYSYTFGINVVLTDKDDAFCAELPVNAEDGTPILLDSATTLYDGLKWDDADMLCVVNAYVSEQNADSGIRNLSNIVRWEKYNLRFCGEGKMDLNRFKELLTSDTATDETVINCRGTTELHTLVADYGTRTLQVIFTGMDGVSNTPEFIDIGGY